METLQLVDGAVDLSAVRRLLVEYRRAVEGFASAADVCA